MKKFDILINTDYLVKFGSEFIEIDLTEGDVKNAKDFVINNDYTPSKKHKMVSIGLLYYKSSTYLYDLGDYRITYYKLKTDNKISIIGEKKGNQIIPKKDLKGFEDTEIFKFSGDEFTLNDYKEILKNNRYSFVIIRYIFSIILIIVGIIIMVKGFKFIISSS